MEGEEKQEEEEEEIPIEELQQQLRKSTLEILRVLKDEDIQYLQQLFNEPPNQSLEFIQSLSNLYHLYNSKLNMSQEEEVGRKKQLDEVREKLEKAKEDHKIAQESLSSLKEERQKTKEQRDEEMKKLSEDLQELRSKTGKEQEQLDTKFLQQLEEAEQKHENNMGSQNQEIAELEKELNKIRFDNKAAEQ